MATDSMWGRVFDLSGKQLVECGDVSLYVMPNDYIGEGIIGSRSYEPHVTAVLRNRLKPTSVFLDVGANVGYFTMLASKLAARVIAIEPNPQNQELIRASVAQAGAQNVTLYPCGLSDRRGEVRLITLGSNGAIVTPQNPDQTFHITAQTVTGDELLSAERRIDMIKIDVEMHEAVVLRGLEQVIRRHRPELIVEYHPFAMRQHNRDPRPELLLEQIVDYGYVLSIIMPDGALRPASPIEVAIYRCSLGSETIHLDLFAAPIAPLPPVPVPF